MPRFIAVAVVLFAVVAVQSAPLLASEGKIQTTLLIGFVAFNPDSEAQATPATTLPAGPAPTTVTTGTIDPMLHAYLQHLTKQAVPAGDVRFVVVRGNYYQVLRWMRDGTIDGAVLSPFMYRVLMSDPPSKRPLGVIEFGTAGIDTIPAFADGNAPAFRAVRGANALDDPDAVLERCVAALIQPGKPQCTFQFVSHLSTTGFFYPLARIAEILERKHQRALDSYLDGDSGLTVMDNLLGRTRFALWHGDQKAPSGAGTRIEFSYASKLRGRMQGKPPKPDLLEKEKWVPLLPEQTAFADDVLAISGASSRGDAIRKRFADDDPVWKPAGFSNPARSPHYTGVREVDEKNQQALQDAMDATFHSQLAPSVWWNRWYDEEEFEFRVDELIGLLRNDQILNGKDNAAIVLPGGGVRGAYQAQILDELYARHVVNDGAADAWTDSRKPLVLKSIIGTSGGALMGYFAARRRPRDQALLTNRWIENDNVAVKLTDVFPRAGTLRWLSILLSLTVFTAVMATLWHKTAAAGIPGETPLWLNAGLFVIFAAAPLAIFQLAQVERTRVPRVAGLAYVSALMMVHVYHCVISKGAAKGGKVSFWSAIIAFVAGGILVSRSGELLPIAIGAALLIVSLFVFAWYAGYRPQATRLRGIADALGTVAVFWIGVTGVFAVVGYFEKVTTLELTGDYWVWVLGASLLMAFVLLFVAARQNAFGRWIDRGLHFCFSPSQTHRVLYNPLLALLTIGFAGLVSWTVFVAPALYDGDIGATTFRAQANATKMAQQTRFVAAITNLGTPVTERQEASALPPGDYYAVERDERDGKEPESARILAWDKDSFIDAVSASGSPFPIYPGRKLEHSRGDAVFVDGGFTHLVPIEGAVLLDAKQVLVISSAKRPLKDAPRRLGVASLLLSDAARTFNFLFDRAQQADAAAQGDVIVATIAPAWPMENPFLMDFRPRTIRTLVHEAWMDMRSRRPGRITSWGQPTAFLAPPGA
jgi:predicted acylesterase/phospholipase RssA